MKRRASISPPRPKSSDKRTALVALLPSVKDYLIAVNQGWYRIPVSTRIVPKNVRENRIEYIAFYLPKCFGKKAFSIQQYAAVKRTTIVKRGELFPECPDDLRRDKEYFKIEFGDLKELPNPIVSYRRRRILFIPTTADKLFNAKEINQVFSESSLEERMWKEMCVQNIPAERQYFESIKKHFYILDFAVFCKHGKIDVEVDGNFYHDKPSAVHYDKSRDIALQGNGWNVMRFHQEQFANNRILKDSLKMLGKTILRFGGILDPKDPALPLVIPRDFDQKSIFE